MIFFRNGFCFGKIFFFLGKIGRFWKLLGGFCLLIYFVEVGFFFWVNFIDFFIVFFIDNILWVSFESFGVFFIVFFKVKINFCNCKIKLGMYIWRCFNNLIYVLIILLFLVLDELCFDVCNSLIRKLVVELFLKVLSNCIESFWCDEYFKVLWIIFISKIFFEV